MYGIFHREIDDDDNTCDLIRMNDDDLSARVILDSAGGGLKDVLSDLDSTCEFVEIAIEEGSLEVRTENGASSHGRMEIRVPCDSDLITAFELIAEDGVKAKYRMALFKKALKPLSTAEKVSLRMDKRGLMTLQYMIKFDGQMSFIQFDILPECERDI